MYIVHQPVLVSSVLNFLCSRTGGCYIDGTLGAGGHAEAVLQAAGPAGRLLGLDADREAINFCRKRLAKYGQRVMLAQGNFADLSAVAQRQGFYPAQGILLDLGVSWHQLATPARGFSYQRAGKLDMRFDQSSGVDALTIINEYSSAELIDIFQRWGEIKKAALLVKYLLRAREQRPFITTTELGEIVDRAIVTKGKAARHRLLARVFQALRIQVNQELTNLNVGLAAALATLARGGRLVVITYHSLEDRLVKKFFQERARGCLCPPEFFQCQCNHQPEIKILTRRVIVPNADELKHNPKSRSAKLRAVEKITTLNS